MFLWTGPDVDATQVKKAEKVLVRGNGRLWNHGPEQAFVSEAKLNPFIMESFVAYEGSDTYINKCYDTFLRGMSR
jgi:hypothetical protein